MGAEMRLQYFSDHRQRRELPEAAGSTGLFPELLVQVLQIETSNPCSDVGPASANQSHWDCRLQIHGIEH